MSDPLVLTLPTQPLLTLTLPATPLVLELIEPTLILIVELPQIGEPGGPLFDDPSNAGWAGIV